LPREGIPDKRLVELEEDMLGLLLDEFILRFDLIILLLLGTGVWKAEAECNTG
jgi:hypothetical protein